MTEGWAPFEDGWLTKTVPGVGVAIWNGKRGPEAKRHAVMAGQASAAPQLRKWIAEQLCDDCTEQEA